MKLILEEEWLSKLKNKVKLYATNYESIAWGKALSCLPLENMVAEMSPGTLSQVFGQFNSIFEEEYRKQKGRSRLEACRRDQSVDSEETSAGLEGVLRQLDDSLSKEGNYSPDNLGNYLSDLFHNSYVSGHSSSSSESRMSRCL